MSDSNTPPLRLQVPDPQNLVKLYGTAVDVPAFGGRLEVDWSPGERVTSVGGLAFFAMFLETGLFGRLCEDFPICYRSNNSCSKRDIVGKARIALLRGDVGYGNDATMCEAESRGIPYLFKIKRSRKIQRLFGILSGGRGWKDCSSGWEALEQRVKLDGWQRRRRVLFIRRPAEKKVETVGPKKPGGKPKVPKKSTALVPTAPAVLMQAEFETRFTCPSSNSASRTSTIEFRFSRSPSGVSPFTFDMSR